jgi:catechol 2,3-dioxygenase-like lactoylglutathione lyase family enzyme
MPNGRGFPGPARADRAPPWQAYGDPACRKEGEIYRISGRRGAYFRDPDGHLMEILTPMG